MAMKSSAWREGSGATGSRWGRLARAAALVGATVVMLSACGNGEKKSPSQVALKVNGQEVSEHQVNLLIERYTQGVAPEQMGLATQRVIEALVDRELAAQAARKDQLDQDPKVIQRMEAAKREVLAQAHLERLQERVTEPSSDEIDRYHDAHPELFSQRRLYSLQETAVAVTPEAFDDFKTRIEATASLDKMNEALRAAGLKSSSRQLSISAEDVPFGVLNQLAVLKPGHSLVQARDGGVRVLTLIASQESPISRPTAQKLIAAFLIKERRNQAAAAGVKALRDQAQIEYLGRFAAPASAQGAGPGAASDAARDAARALAASGAR
jgi:EpsD family peptidyl-prolyl cis-trans isomerase